MHSSTCIIPFAFVLLASADQHIGLHPHRHEDVIKLFARGPKALALHHADLDTAMLRKPSLHATQPQAIPRPLLSSLTHSSSSPGLSVLQSAIYRPQFSIKAAPDAELLKEEEEIKEQLQEELCPTLRYKIALTRPQSSNVKLRQLLEDLKCDIECVELPCTMFTRGADLGRLVSEMKRHDVVAITSPQSARVFVDEWKQRGRPEVNVVSAGLGTFNVLDAAGIVPKFKPSQDTAQGLANELPNSLGGSVLHPTFNRTKDTLQEDLESRGFQVTRLNTYNTEPYDWTDVQRQTARDVDVVAFASPSAVRIWAERVGTDFTAVVIGPRTAEEAEARGFKSVVAPKGSKGIETWAALMRATVETEGQ